MQNVRRRPLSRRKCNYLRVHKIQNKSLLTVTTTPPFCATMPPVRSSSDTNYFMRQSGAHSPCSPPSSSAARKSTISRTSISTFPAASTCKRNCIQPTKPADRLHKSQAADGLALLLSCFISPDTPFPPASAQSGTVPPP